jgi:multidrug efflux pump subunit AcrA (membrane-fusion protein)
MDDTSLSLERVRRRVNVALAVVALVLGGGAMYLLVLTRPEVPKRSFGVKPLSVATLTVVPTVEASPVVGYGTVAPKHQVDVIPQVNGKLVYVNEDLAPGKIIRKGERLFEVDDTMYASRVAQAEAETRRLESVLARQDAELEMLEARIANAERMLEIVEAEYLKTKVLYEEQNVGNLQLVTTDEQRYLTQKDVVAELRNRRDMIPHMKAETEALLDASKARLEQARVELSKTTIDCPFDARVEAVGAYTSQVVTVYVSIARLTNLEAFEISVGIDPYELRWLDESAHPDTLREDEGEPHAEVIVRSTLRGVEYEWRGYVTRFERVDEATRMARMVVEVRNADMVAEVRRGSGDGQSLTLSVGMFCRTELPARRLEEALLVPRHAIHENACVYVFEPDPTLEDDSVGRLGRRAVPMLRSVGDQVLVDYRGRQDDGLCELQPGEAVVVSPLVKPVVGMPVRLRDEHFALTAESEEITPSTHTPASSANAVMLLATTSSLTGTP